jgi:urease accessory protein
VQSRARIVAEADGRGGTRLVTLCAPAPISLRETDQGLFLVASAQGLLGDDCLELEIVVQRDAHLCLRSAAATVAYASTMAQFSISARVAAGGSLEWRPEPLIATSKCRLRVLAHIDLEVGASLDWTDVCILGRTGEEPGEVELRVSVDHDGRPALRHQLVVGAESPGWDGPAILAMHRAVGCVVLVDPSDAGQGSPYDALSGASWAVLPLESGGRLISAVGADLIEVREAMERARSEIRSTMTVALTT